MNVTGETRRTSAIAARKAAPTTATRHSASPISTPPISAPPISAPPISAPPISAPPGRAKAAALALIAGAGAGLTAAPAAAQWLPNFQVYTPTRIGLFGAGYTSSSGSASASATGINASGQVIGNSTRYVGGTFAGNDAWLFTGSSTQQLGFIGAGYEDSNGRRNSIAQLITNSGHVGGRSDRLTSSGASLGQDAWVFNGTTTQRAGLISGAFQGSNGSRNSTLQFLRSNARGAGTSQRYSSSNSFLGFGAWYFDGSTTQQIGLTGPQYVNSSGFQQASVSGMNDAGRIIGTSQRYLANGSSELDAWVFDGTATQQIGLTTGINLSPAGNRVSNVSAINASGHVIGVSARYDAFGISRGTDGWLYNGSSHQVLGLSGPEYTSPQGDKQTRPQFLNDAGRVVGTSTRYSSTFANLGEDAWVSDGTSTQLVGLTGPQYTNSGGQRSSNPTALSSTGFVIGTSLSIGSSANFNGSDAWFADANGSQRIGLYGSGYESSTGQRGSTPVTLNAAGQVIGVSTRLSNSGGFLGSQAWYFDRATGITTPVITGSQSAAGFAFISPRILTDNGYMLGDYSFYTNPALDQFETRAFVFRPDLGFTDLGALIDGSLSSFGIQTLQAASFANLLDLIVVQARNGANSSGVYIMIPAPGFSALLGMGLLAAARRRR